MTMVQADATQLLKLGLTPEDAHVLTNWHPNVVVAGSSQTTEAVLRALTSYLRPPVHSLERSALPNPAQGTLILRELETLDEQGQRELLRWLDGPGSGMQVISLTSAPLYPRVERGTFLNTLYYRLNLVHLEPLPLP